MPTLLSSSYKSPWFLKNGHLQSIYHTFFRPTINITYERERIVLEDGDFVDIDCVIKKNKRVVIILHGLESGSDRPYMKGMAAALAKRNWDVVCFNFRGCSGEPNSKYRSYHSGEYRDLEAVIRHVVKKYYYKEIDLVGFSLGGNALLKYLGDYGKNIPPIIRKAVAISVPCHLRDSAYNLDKGINKMYLKRFIRSMKKKLELKLTLFPDKKLNTSLKHIHNFQQFDDAYTAPAHGFKDADSYWEACSSKFVIKNIATHTLIITAEDDQFLTPSCFPIKEANQNKYVTLEMPTAGGHVGFVAFNKENEYWHETRACEFLT